MQTPQLLTLSQVCEMLQISRDTMESWIKNGKIAAVKLGRQWRFEQADIDRYIKSRKTPVKV